MEGKEKIKLYLSKETLEKINNLSDKHSLPVYEVVEELILEGIKQLEKETLK